MTLTEKGRRADALNQGPNTRRVPCEMIANREADLEELHELCRDMYQRLQWADVLMDGGALDARIMGRARELGMVE